MTAGLLMAIWLTAPPEKADPPPPAGEKPARELADDPQTVRMRIEQNMKAAEEQIRRQELAKSKELQDNVVRDIDILLKNLESPPQSQPESPPPQSSPKRPPTNNPDDNNGKADAGGGRRPSGGSQTNQPPGQTKPRPGGASGQERPSDQPMPNTRAQGNKPRARRGGRSQPQDNARNPDRAGTRPGPANPRNQPQAPPGSLPGEAAGNPGNNPDQARGATMSPPPVGRPERLADMHRDTWGHLPDTLRQEVDQYYRERFMPRYREMLQQYYTRLAEVEGKKR